MITIDCLRSVFEQPVQRYGAEFIKGSSLSELDWNTLNLDYGLALNVGGMPKNEIDKLKSYLSILTGSFVKEGYIKWIHLRLGSIAYRKGDPNLIINITKFTDEVSTLISIMYSCINHENNYYCCHDWLLNSPGKIWAEFRKGRVYNKVVHVPELHLVGEVRDKEAIHSLETVKLSKALSSGNFITLNKEHLINNFIKPMIKSNIQYEEMEKIYGIAMPQLKRIIGIACDGWKAILREWGVNQFNDETHLVEFSARQLKRMFKEATVPQENLLTEIFKEYLDDLWEPKPGDLLWVRNSPNHHWNVRAFIEKDGDNYKCDGWMADPAGIERETFNWSEARPFESNPYQ